MTLLFGARNDVPAASYRTIKQGFITGNCSENKHLSEACSVLSTIDCLADVVATKFKICLSWGVIKRI